VFGVKYETHGELDTRGVCMDTAVCLFTFLFALAWQQLEAATNLKDTLVRFDEESSARTTVIDDQGEYYDLVKANAWLDDDEVREEIAREEARSKAASGSERKRIQVDLLGRRFLESVEDIDELDAQGGSAIEPSIVEAAEKELRWGGARAVDGVGEAGRRGSDVGDRYRRSEAFIEFLGEKDGIGEAGLRFRR
jgi:hypothetical protein